MAKIATAHIEIKPVLNEEALQEVLEAIEGAVAAGFVRGVKAAQDGLVRQYGDTSGRTREEVVGILNDLGHDLPK